MRTQQGWTNGNGTGRRCQPGLATFAVVLSSALGLALPAPPAGAQTLDDSARVVQSNTVRAAQRHQARLTINDTLAGNAAVQTPRQRPPVDVGSDVGVPTDRTVLRDSRFGEDSKVRNSTRSKPMSRTAQAYLESNRQATGLPAVAMICLDCEPEPRCGVWGCGRNSSTIDGAAIVVRR